MPRSQVASALDGEQVIWLPGPAALFRWWLCFRVSQREYGMTTWEPESGRASEDGT